MGVFLPLRSYEPREGSEVMDIWDQPLDIRIAAAQERLLNETVQRQEKGDFS
jgi:hypothetical protein